MIRELFGSLRYFSLRGFWIDRRSMANSVLRSCGVNNGFDLGDLICWEPTETSMLKHQLLIRSDVDAIELVVGHIALNPLNLRSHLVQHIAGSHRQGF